MLDARDLYQETILDHNKRPRNRYKLETANRTSEGYNPLCGDKITVYLEIADDVVREISFQGSGCAISMASASMMTERVKGKTVAEADTIFELFHSLVTCEPGAAPDTSKLGKLAAFAGVREFPIRVKCATLPWHTMRAAIENRRERVSTEQGAASGNALPTAAPPPLQTVEEKVIGVLRTIYDPEMPVNIYDLGLIYDIATDPSGVVTIRMTLTAPGCPVAEALVWEVESKIRTIPGVAAVNVDLVWDPPWNQSMMSEAARILLGMDIQW